VIGVVRIELDGCTQPADELVAMCELAALDEWAALAAPITPLMRRTEFRRRGFGFGMRHAARHCTTGAESERWSFPGVRQHSAMASGVAAGGDRQRIERSRPCYVEAR
jgi:hypothetical protein